MVCHGVIHELRGTPKFNPPDWKVYKEKRAFSFCLRGLILCSPLGMNFSQLYIIKGIWLWMGVVLFHDKYLIWCSIYILSTYIFQNLDTWRKIIWKYKQIIGRKTLNSNYIFAMIYFHCTLLILGSFT